MEVDVGPLALVDGAEVGFGRDQSVGAAVYARVGEVIAGD